MKAAGLKATTEMPDGHGSITQTVIDSNYNL